MRTAGKKVKELWKGIIMERFILRFIMKRYKAVFAVALIAVLAACSQTPNDPTLATQGVDNCQAGVNGRGPFAGTTYFFDDGFYSGYTWATLQVAPGYPRRVAGNWPGLPWTSIDAAVNGVGTFRGKAFFFKGNQYVRYDWVKNRVDPGYPLPISLWGLTGAFANGVDAAVEGMGTFAHYTYFFKGSQYVRYNWNTQQTSSPLPITLWGLTGDFAKGVDLAVEGGPGFRGKTYFFKGNKYVRYDWASNSIDQDPVLITLAWTGLGSLCGGSQE
jgi:Hemopexin